MIFFRLRFFFFLTIPAVIAAVFSSHCVHAREPVHFNAQVREQFGGLLPVPWPSRGIARYDLELKTYTGDGVTFQRTAFLGPVPLEMRALRNWQRADPSGSRFSLLFNYFGTTITRFGFAAIPRERFLPEPSRRALGRYALGLLAEAGRDRTVRILTDFDAEPPRKPFAFLGQVPLTLDYEVEFPAEDGEAVVVRRFREYFVQANDFWLAFVVETEPERIQAAVSALENILSFLYVPEAGAGAP